MKPQSLLALLAFAGVLVTTALAQSPPPLPEWLGEDVWLRREFELAGTDGGLRLRLYHDEDAEVFVDARAARQVGRSVLAVVAPRDHELRGAHGELVATFDEQRGAHRVELRRDGRALLMSPEEGLWSVAADWEDDWPVDWRHAHPDAVQRDGPWLLLTGRLELADGAFDLRDAYRNDGDAVRCVRRFTWRGTETAERATLAVRWQAPQSGAQALLPAICYHGNPSGVNTGFGAVAQFTGASGEEALFEEHRYPLPFASLEWVDGGRRFASALHTLPARVPFGHVDDQWWSLGVAGRDAATELLLLSGPCAVNGQRSHVKALQRGLMPYPDTWVDLPPGAVVEKTFWLEAHPVERRGSGFRAPLRTAIGLHEPFALEGLPSIADIVAQKYRFARSRWHEDERSAGFAMYPGRDTIVMGWAGQAAAPGYALLVLDEDVGDPAAVRLAQRALDHLATAPFGDDGFAVRYEPGDDRWHGPDPVSQGQAMTNFARAIRAGRKRADVRTARWEAFLQKACEFHAARILADDWRPVSTNEGFLVAPLCDAAELFGESRFLGAAVAAAEHFAERHVDMTEPYWGGTLDARCEDKEGAWAGFQAFGSVYEATGEERFLRWAAHALDVVLTYTVVWDIDLPPGRLRDHDFRTRGWTVVSAQNQHLDVFGVLYTPEIYRMGELLGRDDLKRLAILMFRSCGQLIDPSGSQGEQIQHTNFAQHGDISDVYRLRGGYSEGWTVFWITAHFLNAAARFREMGVWLPG